MISEPELTCLQWIYPLHWPSYGPQHRAPFLSTIWALFDSHLAEALIIHYFLTELSTSFTSIGYDFIPEVVAVRSVNTWLDGRRVLVEKMPEHICMDGIKLKDADSPRAWQPTWTRGCGITLGGEGSSATCRDIGIVVLDSISTLEVRSFYSSSSITHPTYHLDCSANQLRGLLDYTVLLHHLNLHA